MITNESAKGRIGLGAAILLVALALGLYLYSERAVPPEPEVPAVQSPEIPVASAEQDDDSERGVGPHAQSVPGLTDPADLPAAEIVSATDEAPSESPPLEVVERFEPVELGLASRALRADLAVLLAPDALDRVAEERVIERLAATVNSLDGEPLPLRFRPLEHVPGLPLVVAENDHWRLPDSPDPRYDSYRRMFDQLDAAALAGLFEAFEPALETAWSQLGENRAGGFRARLIEVIEHLSAFELPDQRPLLERPEVLYEFADPELEQLSWGRKILIRIGPAHAAAVQRKLQDLADRLEAP
ncbi:MAG: DUF3014 domain-containing protein [Wenzhouxiangellaceae bacterium]|nr:DUF3014 domain-containing protein [Wenzhouxiangellaceae bacterium]